MTVTASTLRKLAELRLDPDQMAGVLDILAEQQEQEEARLAATAARTRRYRQRGGDQIPDDMRAAVMARDNATCQECGSRDYPQLDHIHPVSKGGETTMENLQVLCRPCNARKKDRIRKANPRNSAELGGKSSEFRVEVPPKKETSPTPPKEKTTPSTEPNGSSKTRAARLPDDWVLPIDWRADALKAGLPEDRIDFEAEKMRDWSISSPNGAKRDWRAAWRNWAKSATERLPRVRGSPPPQQKPRGSDFFDLEAERISERTGSHRSPQGDWDDAQGVPILTIDHHG